MLRAALSCGEQTQTKQVQRMMIATPTRCHGVATAVRARQTPGAPRAAYRASALLRAVLGAPALLFCAALAGCTPSATPAPSAPSNSAAAIHDRTLTLDTHLDTPEHFDRPGWSIADRHSFATDMSSVDLPRMRDGGLDGGFFVIYTPQGPLTGAGYADALAFARRRADAIARVVAANSGAMAFATTARQARAIAATGKRVVLQSIENSYPLGEDLSLLGEFYRRGVRMAGPVHNGGNQFGDSASGGTARWGGLSPLGRQWVAEMNRLGMVIDGSHASDAALDQMLALSTAPIILSHSGVKSVFDHPRNITDAQLRALAAKGGVMQVNSVFLGRFNLTPARSALYDRQDHWASMSPADQRQLAADWAALDQRETLNNGDFDRFMAALQHCLTVAGVDHCGVGADWDGGGGVAGMADITQLPRITEALLAAGYSPADISKIWSGNAMRVLSAAQRAATVH
ncbi:MAG: dipeptidase [Sphingopyxis sp.]